jgi:stress-induced-phosphoprotein 1
VDDTGPYNKAGLTYRAGIVHEPQNQELMDGLRRAIDAFAKGAQGAKANELLAQAQADPEAGAYTSPLCSSS